MQGENLSIFRAFLETPPLWTDALEGLQQFVLPKIPLGTLVPHIISSHKRLGHQMEEVFLHLMEGSGAYTQIFHNLPVQKDGRSLGEIDFILLDDLHGKAVHVELGYKFYIWENSRFPTLPQLIGPNKRDRFLDKLEKLKKRQLPLLYSPQAKELLRTLGMGSVPLEQYVCFKAQLFGPSTLSFSIEGQGSIAGTWISFAEFKQQGPLQQWYHIPPKSQWPLMPRPEVPWMAHLEAMPFIEASINRHFSPLVWTKGPNGKLTKFFVVWW